MFAPERSARAQSLLHWLIPTVGRRMSAPDRRRPHRFTVSRACSAASAAPDSAAAPIVLAIRSGARRRDGPHRARRPRPLVRPRGETHSPTESCRRSPPATTRSGFGVVREILGRRGGEVRRQRDDHLVDERMGEKRRHAPLENGAPADRQQLFGLVAAEPLTASAGRNDGCDIMTWIADCRTAGLEAGRTEIATRFCLVRVCRFHSAALDGAATIACTRSASAARREWSARRSPAAESDRGRSGATSAGSVRSRPFGITARVPMIATGTIGTALRSPAGSSPP